MLWILNRCLYRGQVALDTDAQFQVPAQLPQAAGDLGDLLGDALTALSGPLCFVEVPALVRQGVDLRLERVVLHGKLFRRFNAIFHQIGKLPLVAVKFGDFLPQQKSRPIPRTASRDSSQQI